MDYGCPICGKDVGGRRRLGPVVVRMEMDCPHCRGRIQLNVHPLEMRIVLGGFAAFAVLAALGYVLHNNAVIFLALIAGMAGPVALPAVERVWLRHWARYAPVASRSGGGQP